MKIGINLAAATLRQNVHELILSSNCPAVIVRATLEDELRAVREWEAQETQRTAAAPAGAGSRKGNPEHPGPGGSAGRRNGTGGLNGKAARTYYAN